jgi:hypothetical protein
VKTKAHIGLYVSPQAIEVAQCESADGTEVRVTRYHRMALPEPLVNEEGEVLDSKALGEALAWLWREHELPCRQVVVGLYGRSAIARLVTLPSIPANQLKQVVLSEAEQYAIFREEEPLVDFTTVESDTESTTVFYVAASQRLIEGYGQALKEARLNAVAFDLAHFAALRHMCQGGSPQDGAWDGVVVMPSRLVITRWQGPMLQVWREVALQLFEMEAQEQLYQVIEAEVSRTLAGQADTQRMAWVAGPSLAESIRLSRFFKSQTDFDFTAAGLSEWPARVRPEALEFISPACLGLALWGFEAGIPSLNPGKDSTLGGQFWERLQVAAAGFKFDKSVAAAVFGVLVGAALGTGVPWLWAQNIQNDSEVLKRENASLESINGSLSAQVGALTREADANQAILSLIGPQAAPNLSVDLLAQTADIIPAEAYLSRVAAQNPVQILLEGGSISQAAGFALARQIGRFKEVSRVQVLDVLRSDSGGYRFRIQTDLHPFESVPSDSIPRVSSALPFHKKEQGS